MSIAIVSSAKVSTTTGLTATLAYAPVAGNIVVVFVNLLGTVGALVVKDNLGNSLTAGPTITNTTVLASFFYTAPSGVTGFTATWTTSRTSALVALEYSVTSGTMSVNASLAGNTASGTGLAQSITVTTQDPNDWIVVGIGDSALTFTAVTGTMRQTVSTAPKMLAMDNTSASAGSLTCSSSSSSAVWGAVALELRFTPSVGGPKNQAMLQGVGA